jgi:SPP1 gp7 family putative phage head morphogenesis protein
MSPLVLDTFVRFEEAAQFFSGKVPLTRAEFDELADWAKLRAFTVASVTKAEVLQDVMDSVQKAIDDGLSLSDFQSLLSDVMDSRGWSGLTPWHAENVYRTNLQSAYGAGRLSQQRAVADEFPYLIYIATQDDRTREEHMALHGVVRPISDPFWMSYYPPWDYQCRCDAESLTAEEAADAGPGPDVDDMEGADFTSPGAGYDYDPDLRDFDPAIRDDVQSALMGFDPADVED